jgi:hypothetical protein
MNDEINSLRAQGTLQRGIEQHLLLQRLRRRRVKLNVEIDVAAFGPIIDARAE